MNSAAAPPEVCRRCQRQLVPAISRRLCPACLLGAGVSTDPATAAATADFNTATVRPQRRVGNYDLLEEVGQGGMGVVFRARQCGLERVVALKMLLYGRWTNERFVQRFRAEARAAAALDHPGIVGIHEVGEHEGQPWFSMDFLPGPSLAELVRERPLPARKAAGLLQSVAEAVAHGHQRGILHRDLKPANILLGQDGQPRVTDFGLAKDARTEADLTLSGETLGTPHYLPPEQVSGRPDAAKPAADIYSLGAILYHLLTGRPPFQADSLEATLLQVLEREPASPRLLNPDVPLDLANICLKCLEKEPSRRFLSAQELADDLGRFLADQPVRARSLTRLHRGWRWCRRRPAFASLLLVATGLLLAVLVGSPLAVSRIRKERDAAAAEAKRARHSEYATDMLLAQQALAENHLRRLDQLLAKHEPTRASDFATEQPGWEWRYLRQQARGDALAVLLTNGPGGASFLALSPDGKTLAVNGSNRVVLVEVASGRVQAEIPHPGTIALGIAFNRQGEFVLQESTGHLRGWSLNPLQAVGVLTNGTTPGYVRFSPDGRWLATAGYEQGIDLWDWPARSLVYRVEEKSGWVFNRGLAFSPDNRTLAWANRAGEVILWDLQERREIRAVSVLPGLEAPLCWLEFSPDGRALACSGVDRSLRLLDTTTWKLLGAFTNSAGLARTISFLPDNRTLLINDDDLSIRIWDWPEWRELRSQRGHRQSASQLELAPDGSRFYTPNGDGQVRVWDPALDPLAVRRLTLKNENHLGKLSTDGSVCLLIDTNNVATLWDTQTLQPRFQGPMPPAHARWFAEAAVSVPDEKIAFLDDDDRPRLWPPGATNLSPPLAGEPADLLAFSPGGQRLVGSRDTGTMQVWDVRTGKRLAQTTFTLRTNDYVYSLVLSPDGTHVAAGSMKGSIYLWDSAAPAPPRTILAQPYGAVLGLAFSADGSRLAAATGAPEVWLWEVPSGRELRRFDPLTQAARCVSFSPDGRRLVVGGADGTLTLWEPETGLQLLRIQGHPDRVLRIAFLPGGDSIASYSERELRIWRAK